MRHSPISSAEISELLDILRSCFQALIPVIERAGIPWHENEAYDDWDAIAQVLYEQIVVIAIRSKTGMPEAIAIPRYDLIYPSYEKLAHIEILKLGDSKPCGIFVGFLADDIQFMSVKYITLTTNELETILHRDCCFSFVLPKEGIPSS